jgi:hypothetical protein
MPQVPITPYRGSGIGGASWTQVSAIVSLRASWKIGESFCGQALAMD